MYWKHVLVISHIFGSKGPGLKLFFIQNVYLSGIGASIRIGQDFISKILDVDRAVILDLADGVTQMAIKSSHPISLIKT